MIPLITSMVCIYVSILCSVISRILRCRITYRYTFGLPNLFHNTANIALGASELYLVAFLPLAQKSVVDPKICECGVFVQFFGAIIKVFYGITVQAHYFLWILLLVLLFWCGFSDDFGPQSNVRVLRNLQLLSYMLPMALIPFLAWWSGIAMFSWSSLFMFAWGLLQTNNMCKHLLCLSQ